MTKPSTRASEPKRGKAIDQGAGKALETHPRKAMADLSLKSSKAAALKGGGVGTGGGLRGSGQTNHNETFLRVR